MSMWLKLDATVLLADLLCCSCLIQFRTGVIVQLQGQFLNLNRLKKERMGSS